MLGENLSFFAATVSVDSKKNLFIETDVSFNNELVISDRFIYIGNAYYFTYQDLYFLTIPQYPSHHDLKRKTLVVTHNRDHAEVEIKGYDGEFCDLILMKKEEGRSESRALRLPVPGELHVLIIPYYKRYISSAIIPLYKLRFKIIRGILCLLQDMMVLC